MKCQHFDIAPFTTCRHASGPCGAPASPFVDPGGARAAWFCPEHGALPRMVDYRPATEAELAVMEVMSS